MWCQGENAAGKRYFGVPLSALLASDPPTIGPYALHGRLGSGGMGVVYLAFGPQDEAVALKVLQPVLAQNREYRQRFVREVDAAGRVSSPHVAALLGSQTEGELLWMATEYVEGASLQHAVETNGPIPAERLRALAVDIAAGVAALHAAGLVHRDLKPANVVLAWSGPKLIDFGIAKPENELGLTETGAVVGSPLWLAPEVLDGRQASRASDVWGWGLCVAYAGTGRVPFGSGDVAAVAYRISQAQPDLVGLPDQVRGPVEAALDKDPTKRPVSAELPQLLGTLHRPAQPSGPAAAEDPTRLQPRDGSAPAPGEQTADSGGFNVPGTPAAGGRTDRRLLLTMAVIAVLLVTIGAVTAVLVLRDGGTGGGAGPTAAPTAPLTLAPVPSATVSASLPKALAVVKALGYTPYASTMKYWDPDYPINVVIASESDKADGYTNRAFFFAGDTFIGNDDSTASRSVGVFDRSLATITLRYVLYLPNDPDCCATGGHADVTFQWNGYVLNNNQAIPPSGGTGPSR